MRDAGTPSPSRKKRNNSTPTKNRAANEKRLILETLIAPATIDTRPKVIIKSVYRILFSFGFVIRFFFA